MTLSGSNSARFNPGHLLLGLLLLGVLALGWRAVNVATRPLPSAPPFQAPWLADRALLSRFDPFFPARAGGGEGLPVTALPFTLHGVRADSATGRGSAIIAAGDGTQNVYAVGDNITDGVTLAAIASDHVVLDRGGAREALWIDSGGDAPVQRFDPGPSVPPGMPPPQGQPGSAGQGFNSGAAGQGLTPENAPPSVLPDDEADNPVSNHSPAKSGEAAQQAAEQSQ